MFPIAGVSDAPTPCQYRLDLAFCRIKREALSIPWNRFWLLVNRSRNQETGCSSGGVP
jgi:hypothetical protein